MPDVSIVTHALQSNTDGPIANCQLRHLTGLARIASKSPPSEHRKIKATWSCPHMECLTNDESSASGINLKDAMARQSQQVSIIHLTSRANSTKHYWLLFPRFYFTNTCTPPRAANIRSRPSRVTHAHAVVSGANRQQILGIPTPNPRHSHDSHARFLLDWKRTMSASIKRTLGAPIHDITNNWLTSKRLT